MTRRLQEATEDALLTGGRAGQRAVEDAGFSEELKAKLLDKISDAKFRKQFAPAFAEAGMTAAAGEGTREMSRGAAWTGEEQTADAVLRMLDDARKPLRPELRGKFRPPAVDMRIKKSPAVHPRQRAVNARDRASVYVGTGMKDRKGLSDEEKEDMRKQLGERFQAGARSLPNTISGLAALANERIEDAIARGQFKDIPRGSAAVRDPRADNPFIDTTEYIMNKMIQRQEIVPPWIEKQQELVKAAGTFRLRLRNDWRRHAARMIAAGGGSLMEQMRRAEEYAAAEELHNPRRRGADQIAVPTDATDDPVTAKMRQQAEQAAEAEAEAEAEAKAAAPQPEPGAAEASTTPPLARPYRDAAWEQAEHKYMSLSVEGINSITRSYNLMAPDLAKKPYLSLRRELASCFAEVAPQLAGEIRQRASRPRAPAGGLSGASVLEKKGDGLWEHLGGRDSVRVHVEAEEKAYGLREWWRDLWKRD